MGAFRIGKVKGKSKGKSQMAKGKWQIEPWISHVTPPRVSIFEFRFSFIPSFAICLLISFFPPLRSEEPPTRLDPAGAVVQLLAIGPGAGEKKEECAATGFLVSAEGHILTNAHVVEDARRCLASSPRGKILAKFGPGDGRSVEALGCDVIAIDEDHDLAVLKTDAPIPDTIQTAPLRLRREPVAAGTHVWVTGHPSFQWESRTYSGRIVAVQPLRLTGKDRPPTDVLILDIPLQRGASGSPVYLESGEVVGIVSRRGNPNVLETVAVLGTAAMEFLEKLQILRPPGRGN
jgi:S1-C subfamily serine protease